MSVIAPITNISRGSLHDGPGIRTVIYFKGCGLRCQWCHNPETLQFGKEILYVTNKCIRCGRCLEICPQHHIISENDMVFIREGCTACGRCADACPSMALQLCGEDKTVEALWKEIQKDRRYYQTSGGGVTFSGGECLLYPEFLSQIAKMCKNNGINTAIESALYVPWKHVEAVISYIDLFYVDLKLPTSEKYRIYTGKDPQLILENIRKLSECHPNILLRIPVIPNVNDSYADMDGFAEIIRSFGSGVQGVELLKYNHLAKAKYDFINREYVEFAKESQSNEVMEDIKGYLAEKSGVNCYFV